MVMGWFPVFENFIEDEFKKLTPTEILYFMHLVSQFNLRGEFYQSDLEIAKTLATSEKTIRRGRAKLVELNLIKVIPGTRTKRNQHLATRYLWVGYATIQKNMFFAQIQRFTYEIMLDYLRKSLFKPADVVVYICLYYWWWRNRGKYNGRDRFYITKNSLRSLTNLPDAGKRLSKIYKIFIFTNGSHLFNFKEELHRFIINDWFICANPDKDDNNYCIAKKYIEEIRNLVLSEKRKRQIKAQQRISELMPKKRKDRVPSGDLLVIFEKLYIERYGHRPNLGGTKRLRDLEYTFGRGPIYKAIVWYFTAETVPKSSRTRTLGNFIAHIEGILKLSVECAMG